MANTTNVRAGDLNYDKYLTEIYDEDIRRSIPGHDSLHKEIANTVQEYAQNHEVRKILELGIGTGLTSEKILELIPTLALTAVDFSEQMMGGAKKRLSKFNVNYILGDYSEIRFDTDFDMVVSVIGMHHQKDDGKRLLFKKIFDSLKNGGIFIFGDLMTYKDKYKAAVNDARHYHHLVKNARDEKSLEEWVYHHKFLNILAPIEDQIKWLKMSGFVKVDVLFTCFNTNLLVAYK